MRLDKGLASDPRPIDQPEGTIRHGKNGVYTTHFLYQNEPGFLPSSANIPFTPIGTIEMDEDVVVFSTDNVTSVIGIYKESSDEYIEVVRRDDLGFSTKHPITGEFYSDSEGRKIVFTDNNTYPKLVNLDRPPTTAEGFRLFPSISIPTIDRIQIKETGGSLRTGQYFFTCQYKNIDGTETNYIPISSGIGITNSVVSEGESNYDGAPANTATNKAIELTINNIDSNYDRIVIVAISYIDGITTFLKAIELPTTTKSKIYTYTGGGETLTPEEVLIPRQSFRTIGTMTQVYNRLYVGNISIDPQIKYQQYANQIKINYVANTIEPFNLNYTISTGFFPSQKTGAPRTFMPGEVYAFYIRWIKNDGTKTEAFHIPGRPREAGDIDSFSNWRRVSTAKPDDWTKGSMGYWENENELYPNTDSFSPLNGSEDLRNKRVRHHRFPTIRTLRDAYPSAKPFIGIDRMYVLGIELSNVIIPDEIQENCQGYEILYAKRDTENSTVITTDLLLLNAKAGNEPDVLWTGGNWHHIKSSAGGNNFEVRKRLMADHARLHSFDLLEGMPEVSPDYMVEEYVLEKGGMDVEYSTDPGGGRISKWIGQGRIRAVADLTGGVGNGTNYKAYARDPELGNLYYNVSGFQYIGENTVVGNVWNMEGERHAMINLQEYTVNRAMTMSVGMMAQESGEPYDNRNFIPEDPSYWNNMTISAPLVTLYSLKNDIYSSFMQQELVTTGKVVKIGNPSGKIYGGDCFIGPHSFITTAQRKEKDPEGTPRNKIAVVWRFLGYFNHNVNYRYEDPGVEFSSYYPKTDPELLTDPIRPDMDPNVILYNRDYSKLSDFIETGIYDPDLLYETNYPYTVARSMVGSGARNNSWRSFLSNEYYESVRNKGPIVNLQGMGSNLIIHHKYTMFVTQDKTTLKGDIKDVTLGSGDIFELEPKEIVYDNKGYAGLQNQHAALLCRHGYFFVDSLEGKVFLYTDSLNDITGMMREFFKNNLITEDNPFSGNGITVGYDKEYDRLFIGIKNIELAEEGRFMGEFRNDPSFINSLRPGDILIKDGIYVKFLS